MQPPAPGSGTCHTRMSQIISSSFLAFHFALQRAVKKGAVWERQEQQTDSTTRPSWVAASTNDEGASRSYLFFSILFNRSAAEPLSVPSASCKPGLNRLLGRLEFEEPARLRKLLTIDDAKPVGGLDPSAWELDAGSLCGIACDSDAVEAVLRTALRIASSSSAP